MKNWGLTPDGGVEEFLDVAGSMCDVQSSQSIIEHLHNRLHGNQFGIIVVSWRNGMGHAMVVESKLTLRQKLHNWYPLDSSRLFSHG